MQKQEKKNERDQECTFNLFGVDHAGYLIWSREVRRKFTFELHTPINLVHLIERASTIGYTCNYLCVTSPSVTERRLFVF